jgi:hypothetical protein
MVSVFEQYASEALILEQIFPGKLNDDVKSRVQSIYEVCEEYWQDQLELLPERRVKYLLLAEAPPWTASGNINYFYNPSTPASNFMQSISKAFFGEPIYKDKSIGYEGTLNELGRSGFLVCDSIPFAMNYSDGNKRSNKLYSQLVARTASSYLLKKLTTNNLLFSDDLKVAFSLRTNALEVIDATRGRLELNCAAENTVSLNSQQIATSKANYLSGDALKAVFDL